MGVKEIISTEILRTMHSALTRELSSRTAVTGVTARLAVLLDAVHDEMMRRGILYPSVEEGGFGEAEDTAEKMQPWIEGPSEHAIDSFVEWGSFDADLKPETRHWRPYHPIVEARGMVQATVGHHDLDIRLNDPMSDLFKPFDEVEVTLVSRKMK